MPILDKSIYPSDWKARSRAAIARAGDKCEECGAPNHATIIRQRRGDGWRLAGWHGTNSMPGSGEYVSVTVLTVHHKVPARDGGSHEPSNLAALCQRCHLRADMPLHIANAALTRGRKERERRMVAGQATLA